MHRHTLNSCEFSYHGDFAILNRVRYNTLSVLSQRLW